MNEAAATPRAARRTATRRVALPAVLGLAAVAALAVAEHWPVARELVLARGSGWLALSALLLSLNVTPLSRALARARRAPAPLELALTRRALGMTAAWLALTHAALALSGTLAGNVTALPATAHLRAGLAALAILLVLLLTSFSGIVSHMRLRFWKQLHRLAYVAALLALQHVLLSPFAPRALTLWLFGAALLLALLRFL